MNDEVRRLHEERWKRQRALQDTDEDLGPPPPPPPPTNVNSDLENQRLQAEAARQAEMERLRKEEDVARRLAEDEAMARRLAAELENEERQQELADAEMARRMQAEMSSSAPPAPSFPAANPGESDEDYAHRLQQMMISGRYRSPTQPPRAPYVSHVSRPAPADSSPLHHQNRVEQLVGGPRRVPDIPFPDDRMDVDDYGARSPPIRPVPGYPHPSFWQRPQHSQPGTTTTTQIMNPDGSTTVRTVSVGPGGSRTSSTITTSSSSASSSSGSGQNLFNVVRPNTSLGLDDARQRHAQRQQSSRRTAAELRRTRAQMAPPIPFPQPQPQPLPFGTLGTLLDDSDDDDDDLLQDFGMGDLSSLIGDINRNRRRRRNRGRGGGGGGGDMNPQNPHPTGFMFPPPHLFMPGMGFGMGMGRMGPRGGGVNPDRMSYEQLLHLGERMGQARNRGASESQIDQNSIDFEVSDPEKEIPKDCTNCAVCMDGFEVGQKARRLPCFHVYHTGCIDEWLKRKDTCPICRQSIRQQPQQQQQ